MKQATSERILSSDIMDLCRKLQHDTFMSEKQREKLKKQLQLLIDQRDTLRETLNAGPNTTTTGD
tara:strand:- start:6922 stop:7116 length:195 start_codon:yes stop_codon:yes gene_type:complete